MQLALQQYFWGMLLHFFLQDSPFKNPLFSLMTIVSFAINGPDIGILRLSGCAEETSIPYPVLAHILWIVLGIIISVLFLTLIVSSKTHVSIGLCVTWYTLLHRKVV